jgi:hypothetical protein
MVVEQSDNPYTKQHYKHNGKRTHTSEAFECNICALLENGREMREEWDTGGTTFDDHSLASMGSCVGRNLLVYRRDQMFILFFQIYVN